MSKVNFFISINYGTLAKSAPQFLLEKVDHYFYMGGRKAQVILGYAEKNNEGAILVDANISLLEKALKIASYCTVVIPTLMFVAKIVLRTAHRFHLIDNQLFKNYPIHLYASANIEASPSAKLIRLFWEQHIYSFKINHGTTSLYYQHFKNHGISTHYPQALENLITKIRKVWADHEIAITPRTRYFKDFEFRYDQARQNNTVTVSFSADSSITQQFTTGARHGGEWIRELRHFLREASIKSYLLSTEEQQTLLEAQSLIEIMSSVSPMIVKINAGCPDLNNRFGRNSLLIPLQKFMDYVKAHCQNWQDPQQVSDYMRMTLLPKLDDEKGNLAARYEITIDNVIHPDYLEFEFIDNHQFKSVSQTNNYPKLDFDKPKKLSNQEILQLRIERNGFTNIEEYKDSRFICDYCIGDGGSSIVTRKLLNNEDQKEMQLWHKKDEIKKYWIKAFEVQT